MGEMCMKRLLSVAICLGFIGFLPAQGIAGTAESDGKSHARTSPLNRLCSESQEQCLDMLPFQAGRKMPVKDKPQGFSVWALRRLIRYHIVLSCQDEEHITWLDLWNWDRTEQNLIILICYLENRTFLCLETHVSHMRKQIEATLVILSFSPLTEAHNQIDRPATG